MFLKIFCCVCLFIITLNEVISMYVYFTSTKDLVEKQNKVIDDQIESFGLNDNKKKLTEGKDNE